MAYNFKVELDSLVVGGFTEVSGLQVETEVEDYREGGLNNYIHRLPGPSRYPTNLTAASGSSRVVPSYLSSKNRLAAAGSVDNVFT